MQLKVLFVLTLRLLIVSITGWLFCAICWRTLSIKSEPSQLGGKVEYLGETLQHPYSD